MCSAELISKGHVSVTDLKNQIYTSILISNFLVQRQEEMSALSWTLLASEFPDTMHDVRCTHYCITLLIQVLHKYISLHIMISSESSRKHSNINSIMLEE